MSLNKTANGVEGSRKKAGKVFQTMDRDQHRDAGAKVDNVQVYDKQ